MKLSSRQIAAAVYSLIQHQSPRQTGRQLWHFLEKRKLNRKLPDILLALENIFLEQDKNLTIRIESVHPLTPQIKAKLKEKLKKYYPNKTIFLETAINPSLLGGIKIIAPHQQIDLSVKAKLTKLTQQI